MRFSTKDENADKSFYLGLNTDYYSRISDLNLLYSARESELNRTTDVYI